MQNEVPQDKSKAVFWFRKAAAQGDADAQSALKKVAEEKKRSGK